MQTFYVYLDKNTRFKVRESSWEDGLFYELEERKLLFFWIEKHSWIERGDIEILLLNPDFNKELCQLANQHYEQKKFFSSKEQRIQELVDSKDGSHICCEEICK